METYKKDRYIINDGLGLLDEGIPWVWRNLYKGSMYVEAFKQLHNLRVKQFNRALRDTHNNPYSSS